MEFAYHSTLQGELVLLAATNYNILYTWYTLKVGKANTISPSSGSLATLGCEVSAIGTSGGRSGRSTVRVEQHLWLKHHFFYTSRRYEYIDHSILSSSRYDICQQNIS